MYSIEFYICSLVIAFLIAIPLMLIVIVISWLSSPKKKKKMTLSTINTEIKKIKNSQELQKLLDKFLQYFIVAPEEKFQEWLECINALISLEFASLDMIVDFKEKLESKNLARQKDIANTIALVLKNKKR
ncbi:hypothetical protein CQA57_07380 [Helicobacter anseris]|uniref:Uncharacterized protein n=1 Tax=Helicobacter anseris TaxID=375926 RepID=A0A3D8J424_9HELI|nr:hypothetical protein [Helicobacter anseris]RDU71905.1 hypothetical protein CQA57_07380 [Helicobacter anseris]